MARKFKYLFLEKKNKCILGRIYVQINIMLGANEVFSFSKVFFVLSSTGDSSKCINLYYIYGYDIYRVSKKDWDNSQFHTYLYWVSQQVLNKPK